jgi:RNA polymerase sigma-70 factor (ECF subfamily)
MDKHALEQLFAESRAQLVKWVRRFLRNREDVEDVVQETFVRSYQQLADREIENPKAYIFTAAKNLALKQNDLSVNKLRAEIDDLELSQVISLESPVFQSLAAKEEMARLCEAIRALPLQCRRVFVLKKIYGFSHEEIATQLEISENTVHQHLAKAVARCTLYMHEKGYRRGQAKLRLVSKAKIQES